MIEWCDMMVRYDRTVPDDIAPLVELEGQVPVTPDPLRESGVHDGLRRGPNGDRLFQIVFSALSQTRMNTHGYTWIHVLVNIE